VHLGQSTSWSLIRGAADGRDRDREDFVERYAPVARSYFEARWRGGSRRDQAEDAVQEVFVECFRAGGVLERADPAGLQSFRAFFYGVVQNVARRIEADAKRQRAELAGSNIELDRIDEAEASLSEVFDRSFARALLREALQLQRAEAGAKGERALKRLEILRLRFEQGLPIREIAASWGADPAFVHREYLAARREFKTALMAVLKAHRLGSDGDLEAELGQLRSLLS
jgi:RNA polymerase sigma factor (sigma-70 family)